MRKKVRVALAVVLTLLAAGAAALWWFWPANVVTRELRAFDFPAGVTMTDEAVDPGSLCFDQCAWGDRYYASTLPVAELAAAVEEELRDRGYEITMTGRCYSGAAAARQPFVLRDCTRAIHAQTDDFSATARFGTRRDGRPGMKLSVSHSGW